LSSPAVEAGYASFPAGKHGADIREVGARVFVCHDLCRTFLAQTVALDNLPVQNTQEKNNAPIAVRPYSGAVWQMEKLNLAELERAAAEETKE
jgi:hypothetical protein